MIISYLKQYKTFCAIGLYVIIAVLLKTVFSINIFIPCLWKTFFGFSCPGCGLTTAFVKLVQFDVIGAFQVNYLIFVIIPGAIFFSLLNFFQFKKKYSKKVKLKKR